MKLDKTLWIGAALAAVLALAGWVALRKGPPAAAASAASGVTLTPSQSPSQASALTVELVAPEPRRWAPTLAANGALAAWEEVVVSPETGGLRIAELLVNVGQRVARGQLMARLADDTVRADLAKQEALVAQAEASLLQAEGNLKRARAVDVAGALAPQKIDEYQASEASARAALASVRADLRSAQLKLAQTRIVAPDAGVVASRSGLVGNVASAGSELYRLIRQGRIEWRAELDAQQLAQVHEGQAAQLTLPGGQTVAGTVRLVAPTLSSSTGRGIAYVNVAADAAAPGPARIGAYASGRIELPVQPVLTLPEAAVVLRDGRAYVYRVGRDGKASAQVVGTGRRQEGRVELTSGLEAGTRVVARGGAFLSDGAQVTVVAGGTTGAVAASAAASEVRP